MMDLFVQDVRFAVRGLLKSPGFTVAATLSLALGIGANATIFTWLNALLLRPMPGVEDMGALVSLQSGTKAGARDWGLSYPDYVDLRDRSRLLSGVLAWSTQGLSLQNEAGEPERVWGMLVSGNYFDVLSMKPKLGRYFRPDEDQAPLARPVVVISERLFERRFGSDRGLIGRTISLNNHAFTVVGVAPAVFRGTDIGLSLDCWVPMAMQEWMLPGKRLEQRGNHWLDALARLKPGVTMKEAQAELDTIAAQIAAQHPHAADKAVVEPLWTVGGGRVMRPVLLVLAAVAGVVLLIACANVANLMLARGAARRREIAVRISLGATRSRLLRQLLTESLLLALLAGAAALLVALWSSGLLLALIPPTNMPVGVDLRLDLRALAFTAILSLLTTLAFGLAPAWQGSRPELVGALKEESGAVASGRPRLRNALVATQVALSVVLLASAGLFVRSLREAQKLDLGFNSESVLLASFDLFPNGYTPEGGRRFLADLVERTRALPGVTSVTLARRVPLGFGGTSSTSIEVDGYQAPKESPAFAHYNVVGPDYFKTMQIPIARGRDFTTADASGAPRVVVISQALAERYFEGRDPLGLTIRGFDREPYAVVGVARDTRYRTLGERPLPVLYIPVQQFYRPDMQVHLRAAVDPATLAGALQGAVRGLDPNLPLFGVRTLVAHIGAAAFQQSLAAQLLSLFGSLAIALAAVGLYGVLAFTVAQRTREIGIRIAVGGTRRDIFALVMGQGLRLGLLGTAIGTVAALAAARPLASLLIGVTPFDPLTFASVLAILAAVGALACALPARRATRIDPLQALRHE